MKQELFLVGLGVSIFTGFSGFIRIPVSTETTSFSINNGDDTLTINAFHEKQGQE